MSNPTSFQTILNKYRKFAFSERDKGDKFERLMQAYLQTDPKYAYRFKNVWLWNEFPGKLDLGGGDTGIDLVALTHDGDYWAVQCKCYQETSVIDKPAVDSFLSTSSREFKNEQLKTVSFAQRLWISTTNKWGPNATEAIKNQNPPVVRLGLYDLIEAPVDWRKLDNGIHGEQSRIGDRDLKPHQKEALTKTREHFKTQSRGKLIMACGTGKTFNSLRIAENEIREQREQNKQGTQFDYAESRNELGISQTDGKGLVLFLVPSIALLGQTLREWTTYAKEPINAVCICSDPEVSKNRTRNDDSDSFSVVDLALPASPNVNDIIHQFKQFKRNGNAGMTVVFSTYQSIEVIAKAQKKLRKECPNLDEFDLIICDEAHRTTGVSLAGEDESAFTKVHDNTFIKAKKRLYMTATPRLYSDDIKSKAAQAEAILCSMDDPKLYGEEIYRIGFGEAVEKDLLTDYKVLILTLSDKDVPPAVQKMIADKESEINTDDASKLIGCTNALSKQVLGDLGIIKDSDPEPMRRAVAFCQSIAVSRKITATFNTATDAYISSLPAEKKDQMVSVDSRHIDGTMSAAQRDELLGWLKADTDENECRILTNVRCLSEGVDVPTLDAVLFLSARNSQVDVVQSVGRVMRKAPGKKYGYIIIPVVVPSDVDAAMALDDNERYKVVWTVLNALRAHDDRFNATVNKIELNKQRPEQILVGRPEYSFDGDGMPWQVNEDQAAYETSKDISRQLALQFEQLQNVVFARLVNKVGDRRYWEQWAKSVAEIAERQLERITRLIQDSGKHQQAFDQFLRGLQSNINPGITQQEAVEMLSQHIITKPVFEALFEGYSFVKNNPISVSMQTMMDLLEDQSFDKDAATLDKFYESVKMRASGIDNAEGKQRIIIELYDKFFKTAFPKMVERLGIVYTPVEVVDFIIHSVEDVLQKEFGRSLSDENIHILDPFTGTGTFITRLLQSGLIRKDDLLRKYQYEIHANEIVLLAYYIAAVNIENAFHDMVASPAHTDDHVQTHGRASLQSYQPFEGICLTDTFQLGESDERTDMKAKMFPENSDRVLAQKKAPLQVIIGNPPYSVGQRNANDNAGNQEYITLNNRISQTYAANSDANNKNSLYDSYIKAFRWSSDRLDKKNGGVIAFISNNGWIDKGVMAGFRKSLESEFSSIYTYDLRGAIRGRSGDNSKREGQNVFDIMTGVAITILVKKPDSSEKANIYYNDIGDYLSRKEKLTLIKMVGSLGSPRMNWITLQPDEHSDWLSKRNGSFGLFLPIAPEVKFNLKDKSFFITYSCGVQTNRDAWVYNFSKEKTGQNISRMIDFYNGQTVLLRNSLKSNPRLIIEEFLEKDERKIKWSSSLLGKISKFKHLTYNKNQLVISTYRPFTKSNLYFDASLNHRPYQIPKLFPENGYENLLICISGSGFRKDFALMITKEIPDLEIVEKSQCFPLYYYEERPKQMRSLFDEGGDSEYIRRDGVSDFILERAKKQYGKNVSKEDIFYYVYGFLHSPEYREKFANDLKKMLPRLPLVEDVRDFWAFSKAGRKLAELHINYENVPAYPGVAVNKSGLDFESNPDYYRVEKMRFPKKDQKGTIIYNSKITVSNIPAKAYQYVVNGKSAIEWIMERYQITTHKKSGIKNDPNDWSSEVGKPSYILDLLLSVINVSVQTVEIVEGLPKVNLE